MRSASRRPARRRPARRGPESRRPASPRALLATASVAVALAAADIYVVVLALPDMMSGVGLGIESLQRATPIVSGFLLGYVATLPLTGRLCDLVSRQRILLACLSVFVVGSAVTALAVELPVLVGGRVLQGIGGGGLVPATLAMVADLWPPERRGTPLGVVGAVQELGSVLGPLLGALVLAIADWRAIFWLNVVLGVVLAAALVAIGGAEARPRLRVLPTVLGAVAAALAVLTLTAPERLVTDVRLGMPFVAFAGTSRLATPIGVGTGVAVLAALALVARAVMPVLRRVDLLGALLLGLALGALVITFASADPEREVVGPWGWGLAPAGAAAVAAYLWRHRTANSPLIPRGVLQGRVTAALVVSLLAGVALVAIVVDVPVLARLTVTDSQTVAALVLVRFLVAVPVGALAGGWLLRHLGAGVVAGAGLALAAGALTAMAGWGTGSLDAASSTLTLVLVGLGLGLAIAPVNATALADAPRDAHGVASAAVVVSRMVGMVVGLALLTAIGLRRYYDAVATLPDQLDSTALAGAGIVQVQSVFAGGAVAAGVAALIALALGLHRPGSPAAARPVRTPSTHRATSF